MSHVCVVLLIELRLKLKYFLSCMRLLRVLPFLGLMFQLNLVDVLINAQCFLHYFF